MQKLFLEAKYKEAEERRGKKLNKVDEHRIRKKFKFPSTIWDGDEIIHNFRLKKITSFKCNIF